MNKPLVEVFGRGAAADAGRKAQRDAKPAQARSLQKEARSA